MTRAAVELTRSRGVIRVRRPGTRWLHAGWNGGRWRGPDAYSVTVPDGWSGEDVDGLVRRRLAAVGAPPSGPTLLTAVAARHARVARRGPVLALCTAGLSNPAELPPVAPGTAPMGDGVGADPDGRDVGVDPGGPTAGGNRGRPTGEVDCGSGSGSGSGSAGTDRRSPPGTVNLLLVVGRRLSAGARPNAVAMAAEAKAATLTRLAGVTGTSTDAILLGDDPEGPPARYVGSATDVGGAIRVAVRDALVAALAARYPERHRDGGLEAVVASATDGVRTAGRASVRAVPRAVDGGLSDG